MSGVQHLEVPAGDADQRLDRWLKQRFPGIGHARLQKLLRTGQVRVDGRRASGDARLAAGQNVRVPPLVDAPARPPASARDAAFLEALVLYRDEALIVVDKPPGLAVQGGTRTTRHLDGMLGALAQGGERPRLVHRLDRDTSGLLVLARSAAAARTLAESFRRHRVAKLYWALVAGRPPLARGQIDLRLAKRGGPSGERVAADADGQAARTRYAVVQRAGKVASWLALLPLTGRTHQLRAHCAAMGTPILGDNKYGGAPPALAGLPTGLMLHARELRLPHPDGGELRLTAPLPAAMRAAFKALAFEPDPGLPGATLGSLEEA